MVIIRIIDIDKYIVGCLGVLNIIILDINFEFKNDPWPEASSNHP
jgi:hypothetical protein